MNHLLHLESRMVDAIACVGGMRYSTGSTSNHAGTTDEYLFFDHHIFCFDLECGEEFQPPIAAAITAAQEVAAAVRSLGSCAAGETGLDIHSTTPTAHRSRRPRAGAERDHTGNQKPWYVEALPESQWPRLLVYRSWRRKHQPKSKCRHCSTKGSTSNSVLIGATPKSLPVQKISTTCASLVMWPSSCETC